VPWSPPDEPAWPYGADERDPILGTWPTSGSYTFQMSELDRLVALRDQIATLIAAALDASQRHDLELERLDELHLAESARRDEAHIAEIQRRDDIHLHELETAGEALQTRDVIGQAKGVLIATLGCSPERAFHLLRLQSQHENRKVVEISAEIVQHAIAVSRRSADPQDGS
jgi:hypothetical protein